MAKTDAKLFYKEMEAQALAALQIIRQAAEKGDSKRVRTRARTLFRALGNYADKDVAVFRRRWELLPEQEQVAFGYCFNDYFEFHMQLDDLKRYGATFTSEIKK